jgi:hypothetical protein
VISTNEEDIDMIDNFLTDEVNYNYENNFKHYQRACFEVMRALVRLHSAIVIGSPFINEPESYRNTFLLSAFCKPGKQSVYIYNP